MNIQLQFQILYALFPSLLSSVSLSARLLLLSGSSVLLIVSLFLVYIPLSQEVSYADHKA